MVLVVLNARGEEAEVVGRQLVPRQGGPRVAFHLLPKPVIGAKPPQHLLDVGHRGPSRACLASEVNTQVTTRRRVHLQWRLLNLRLRRVGGREVGGGGELFAAGHAQLGEGVVRWPWTRAASPTRPSIASSGSPMRGKSCNAPASRAPATVARARAVARPNPSRAACASPISNACQARARSTSGSIISM